MAKRSLSVAEKIINAAMEVFAKYGYFRASVQLIATRAGVSKGLVFWHFRTKDKLMVEVAKRALPTDVIHSCIDKELRGKELLQCVGMNYANKYRNDMMRMLLINTFSLANVNKKVKKELSKICNQLLDTLAERAFEKKSEENIIKIRAFFGGLLCYVLNPPSNIDYNEYLNELIKWYFPK